METIDFSRSFVTFRIGPVLFPDLSQEPDLLMTNLQLAYAAFNHPDWIEFIVREPTPVTEGVAVYHYSRPVRCDSKNQICKLP